MKKFYHATPFPNLGGILAKGILKGCDGVVYLAETSDAACKFIAIRCFEPILVVEAELDEALVEESFDHNFAFFKERAWVYPKDIDPDQLGRMWKYE